MASDDRTELPTAKRLRDARKRGQLPRSKDVSEALQLVGLTIALVWAGPWMARGMASGVRLGIERMGELAHRELALGDLTGLAVGTVTGVILLVAPVAATAAVLAVGGNALQGGWNVASEAIRLDFTKLNPANGLKRLAFQHAGIDLVRMLLVVSVISWLAYRVVTDSVLQAPRLGMLPPLGAAALGWQDMLRMLRDCAVALALFALADLGVARWRYTKSLRMTKQEVKDDMRLTEGSPEIKGRIRRAQRDAARRRMLSAVPKATVVITNPTHFAVALEYRREAMAAPRVVAKGQDKLALRIREIAREAGVPIVENKPLAQTLYKSVEVGEFIPGELFGAVAEVLAYLMRLKQIVL
ncbi:MAG: flagellar biosynthesis protein FlhB [Vicinamibacterales bacterium]|nr:flagellar biosynthesis protein FlhB [Vicinamibacterales bacterium]